MQFVFQTAGRPATVSLAYTLPVSVCPSYQQQQQLGNKTVGQTRIQMMRLNLRLQFHMLWCIVGDYIISH